MEDLKIGSAEPVKEEKEIDFKERYGTLRNQINMTRSALKDQMSQTKEAIEKREEELKLLKHRLQKLEGAIEVSDVYLKEALPSKEK